MATALPFLSICPRIHKEGGQLIASTAWFLRILSLGLGLRKVIVDPHKKVVLITGRWFWFFTTRRKVPFRFIQSITYRYSDVNPEAWWTWAHDSTDVFSAGLKLVDGERIHLFRFYGDGTFTNTGPLPDWVYWDNYLFDLSGEQEKRSRVYVELLAQMIGVSIEP
jgi:hypothetical protein